MTTVRVAQRSVALTSENRNRRVLMSFAIFTAEIVFESAFAGAQQTQSVPTSIAGMGSQRGGIGSSDYREVNVLRQMMSNSIEGIDPGSAHRTGIDLFLSEHEVIDHQRAIGISEQFAHPNSGDGFVAIGERSRAFKK